jgi:hypothetical protein
MQRLRETVRRLGPTLLPMVVFGPTGTSKELVAAAQHRTSPWGDRPFLAVHCGALPGELPESELFGRFCQLSRQSGRHAPFDAVSLCSLEDGEHGGRATEMNDAAATARNMLIVTHARTKVVAEFVIGSTEPVG